MFDFILEIPPEFCYGVVESYEAGQITILKSEWAPGIWAGCKDMWITIKDKDTKKPKDEVAIYSVNLETRQLYVGLGLNYVEPGDLIYPKVKNGI